MLKKEKGSITIFLCLTFVIIVSLICTLINSARVSASIASINMINSISIESAFSKYNRELFEEFGILAIEGNRQDIKQEIERYIGDNTDVDNVLLDIRLKQINVISCFGIKDEAGAYFARQVTDYMKYAAPIEIGADIIDAFLGIENDSVMNNVSDEIVELSDTVYLFQENMYKLLSLVDGVQVVGTDVVNEYKTILVNDEFAKLVVKGDNLGILEPSVYMEVKDKVYDPTADLYEMILWYQAYMDIGDYDSYLKFVDCRDRFYENANRAGKKYEEAIAYAKICSVNAKVLDEDSRALIVYLEENEEHMDQELYQGLLKEAKSFSNMSSKDVNMVCDVSDVLEKLEINYSTINYGLLVKNIGSRTETVAMEENLKYLTKLEELFRDFTVDDICFDYKYINVYQETEGNVWKALKEFYDKGILGMVMEGKVSEKKLPDKYKVTMRADSSLSAVDYTTQTILFDEYVMEFFNSATDKPSNGHVDYEVEYILYGSCSDEDNLSQAVSDVIHFRQALNLTYLFTDSEKMLEATELATVIAGAIGIPGLVTVTKFAILAIWAYAEAIVDAKILLSGEKLSMIKTRDEWKLSLERLLDFDLSWDKEENRKNVGFGYEDYLRFFLFVENYGSRNIGTINVIEMRMINKGNPGFSMSKMVVGANVSTIYDYGGKQSYLKSNTFSY